MFKWIKRKLGIFSIEDKLEVVNIHVKNDVMAIKELRMRLNNLEKQFECTNRLSADINMKDRSYIILSGNWRGKPYVNIYPLYEDEMNEFIKEFKYRFAGREFKLDTPKQLWI